MQPDQDMTNFRRLPSSSTDSTASGKACPGPGDEPVGRWWFRLQPLLRTELQKLLEIEDTHDPRVVLCSWA